MAKLIPTHVIGNEILKVIDSILGFLGLGHDHNLEQILYVIIISAVAIGIGLLIRIIVLFLVRKYMQLRSSDVANELTKTKVLTRCSHIIPPLVFLAFIPIAFNTGSHALSIIERLAVAYSLVALAIGLNSILTFMWTHYDSHENKNNHPLRGLLNTGHGIVWIVISIIIISVLVDKSPTALLAGLGAFAAALMLIFKDSILGLVAGIQMSQNDMLRVGDWIVVPSTPANGTVIEVTLTVVKVKNWDNTVIYLPPYTLVSTSFQNWRGVFESGARQIERSVYIDNTTIVPISADEVDRIVKTINLQEFTDFVNFQRKNLADNKGYAISTDVSPVNGTMDTNLGLFRAYMGAWLRFNKNIDNNSYIIARTLEQSSYGTPLQIYCYSSITSWTGYEAVRSEVFEHVAAMAPVFGLKIYNSPFGNSFEVENAGTEKGPSTEEATAAAATEAK